MAALYYLVPYRSIGFWLLELGATIIINAVVVVFFLRHSRMVDASVQKKVADSLQSIEDGMDQALEQEKQRLEEQMQQQLAAELEERARKQEEDLNDRFELMLRQRVELETKKIHSLFRLVRNILDSIPSAIVVVNGKEQIILANHSAYDLFPPHDEGLRFANMQDVLPDKVVEAIRKVASSHTGMFDEEFSIEEEGKPSHFLHASIVPLVHSGAPKTMLVAEDVTERRRLENELRTRERIASIGTLVAGVAHEINNPLNAVVGLTELLLHRDSLPNEIASELEEIRKYAMRIAEIVQGLNRYTRLAKADQRTLASINTVVEESVALVYQANAFMKEVELRKELDPNLPEVRMNPGEISQVVINLLNNALDALSEKKEQQPDFSPRLSIRTALEQTQQGRRVLVVVEDNGIGIGSEALSRIYDPFFSTKSQGSGLGLAISVRIVHHHGGSLQVESQQGSFTRFVMSLPAGNS